MQRLSCRLYFELIMKWVEIMKIKSINNLTMFNENQEIDLSKKLTIIFGYNGFGKSSISRLLNSASNQRFENFNLASLNALDSDSPLEYIILDDDESVISKLDAVVFNKDFVDSVIRKASFIENKIATGSVKITDITFPEKESFDEQTGKLKTLKTTIDSLQQDFELKVTTEITNEKKIIGASKYASFNFEKFNREIENIEIDFDQNELYKLRNRIADLGEIDEEIKVPNVSELTLDNISEFVNIIEYSEESLKIDLFDLILQGHKEWITRGFEFTDFQNCPFCQQSTSDLLLMESYKKYAESTISKKIERLNKISINIIAELEKSQKELMLTEEFTLRYKTIIDNSNQLLSNLARTKELVSELMHELNQLCSSKKRNIYSVVKANIDLFENATLISSSINQIIVNNEKIRETFLKTASVLKKTRQNCLENFIFPAIKKRYIQQIDEIKIQSSEYERQKEETFRAEQAYIKELRKRNPVVNEINKTFESLGFEKYRIDHNFSLIHKRSKREVDRSFTEKLSDGEKSLVAFALFYSQLKLKVFGNPSLVVIDDPVSSLDYENIYNIYYLIDGLVDISKNSKFLICTHNHIYLNCLLYKSEGVRLLRIEKDSNNKSYLLESKLKSPTVYIDKLSRIKQISTSDLISNQDKLIIPNFCRYILETLSIFIYPNCKEPLKELHRVLTEENAEQRSQSGSCFINDNRLNVLFATINKGSHSTIEQVLDRENDSDNLYKKMCTDTVKIVGKFAKHQLDNLAQ